MNNYGDHHFNNTYDPWKKIIPLPCTDTNTDLSEIAIYNYNNVPDYFASGAVANGVDSDFEIDKLSLLPPEIIEMVLSPLDTASLLNTRLVCHRLSFFATEQLLQKNLSISFQESLEPFFISQESPHFVSCQHSSRSLAELTTLLKYSTHFPIASFKFTKGLKRMPISMPNSPDFFLNIHGSLIKKLQIIGRLHFEDLKNLLFTQLPNLEELELTSIYSGPQNDVHRDYSQDNSTFCSLLSPNEPIPSLKLKIFKAGPEFSSQYFQEIIQISPNIR